ncbi:MAG: FAD-linked oxidase C-terminal domain-containing protein [Gemmatimonadota bacterium]
MSLPLSPDLVTHLNDAVGRDHVITDPNRLFVYESDGLTQYRVAPRAVVLPATTDELAAVVSLLHGERIPVVPRGSGTGLSGGALPSEDAVVVGTARMNRILAIDSENRLARVQPGVVNGRLTEAAQPHGLYYAPDPSSQSTCTLGGNVAENSGGPHCLKYGVTGRYVTGLTVVLADGEVVRLGGAGRMPDGALDLVGLFVGSEGCFGIAAEIEVRLLPVSEGVRTLLGIFDSMEDAGRAVTAIIAAGMLPAALEIVDQATIRAVEASVYAAGYPVDAGAALVIEFDGTEAGLDADAAQAEKCCREAGARDVQHAVDEAHRAALWKGRKKAFGAMGRIAPDLLVQDATVPRTRLPDVLAGVADIGRRYGLEIANVFHAGDGNLHPNIIFDRHDPDQLARVEKASKEIMALCVDAGGTITGEHGVGVDKRQYMHLVHGPRELAAMAEVKAAFDPDGLFNPGKVLPAVESDGVGPTGVSRGTKVGGARAETEPSAEQVAERGTAARPADTVEVVEMVMDAGRQGHCVVPIGTGRHLDRAIDEERCLVLSTEQVAGIEIYEPADLTLTARAGTPLRELAETLAPHDQWLPFDPPDVGGRTLGGLVASGLSGPLGCGYGALRNHVLGATVVCGDGRELRLGGRVVKNVAGFDLLRPVVGSRGSLAVVTSVCVRLFPVPQVDRVLVARAASTAGLVEAARAVACAPLLPASTVLAVGASGLDGGAALLVRLHGARATVDADQATLERVAGRAFDALEGGEARGFTEVVRDHPSAAGVGCLAVFPSRLGEALGTLDATLGAVPLVADAYEGRIRFGFDADAVLRLGELRRLVEASGGSLGFERAPSGTHTEIEAARTPLDPRASALAERVRKVFDPGGTFSPMRAASVLSGGER